MQSSRLDGLFIKMFTRQIKYFDFGFLKLCVESHSMCFLI